MQHKVPNAKLLSISPLEKTATHDLPALLDKLLSHCPSFKHALVRSTADMKKHSALDYGKAAQRACDAGCMRRFPALQLACEWWSQVGYPPA